MTSPVASPPVHSDLDLTARFAAQRQAFAGNPTPPAAQRRQWLKSLREALLVGQAQLIEAIDQIQLVEGSLIAKAYASEQISEGYRCRYGINPAFIDELLNQDLRVSGQDARGEPRAIELQAHPFFVATLFQPERAALKGQLPPLVAAFVEACARNQR